MRLKGKRFLSAKETLPEKCRKKLLEATSWYREKEKEEDHEKEREGAKDHFFNFDSWNLKNQKNMKIPDPERVSARGNWRKGMKMKKQREKEKLKELLDEGERVHTTHRA